MFGSKICENRNTIIRPNSISTGLIKRQIESAVMVVRNGMLVNRAAVNYYITRIILLYCVLFSRNTLKIYLN